MNQPVEGESVDAGGSSSLTGSSSINQPQSLGLALLWIAFIGLIGALACSWMIVQFGEIGSLSFWALGALGGYGCRRITRIACPLAGWLMVIVCVVVLVVSDVSWIHFKTIKGAEGGWVKSITLLPAFVRTYKYAAVAGALFTGFGAYSAYSQAGRRYRIVYVEQRS